VRPGLHPGLQLLAGLGHQAIVNAARGVRIVAAALADEDARQGRLRFLMAGWRQERDPLLWTCTAESMRLGADRANGSSGVVISGA
jgi:hypothetical protein